MIRHILMSDSSTVLRTIAGALADAVPAAGDTIYVHEGTYVENVDVDKRITLIGGGADAVTVEVESRKNHVFEVIADYATISGFNVTGVTGHDKAGIYLNGRQHCNISDDIADSNQDDELIG